MTLSRAGQAMVSTLSLLVLARLLEPKAFGLVALAGALLVVLQLLQASGLASALIYRRYGIEEAAGSVLVYSTAAAVVLFGTMVLASPLIARAFDQPEATNVIRSLSVVLVIRGLGVAPTAILEREMNFRARAIGEIVGTIFQGITSISLAFAGFGVWSLIAGSLISASVQTAVAWYLAPVHASPRHASWSILRGLLAYGRFITAGNVLTLATRTLDNFFVARLLGATALGTYAVAFRLATLPAGVLVNAGRVLFPAYALLQDDLSAFRRTFVQTLQRVALLALPVTIGFAVAGEPVVDALLGSKWAAAVGPLRILALYAFVLSLAKPCGAVYQAAGKPHLVPLLSIPMLVAMVPGLIFLTNRFEANGTALAMLLAMLFSAVPSVVVAMRILELRAVELRRALAPTLLCSGILAAVLAVLLAPTEDFAPVVRLAILIAAGAVAYAVSALLLARETVSYLWVSLKGRPAT